MRFYTPAHAVDLQTYTKRSSSQMLGGVAFAIVILMVWLPFFRPSFLNNWIGISSLAAKELTVCWSAPSVDAAISNKDLEKKKRKKKKGKFVSTYRD